MERVCGNCKEWEYDVLATGYLTDEEGWGACAKHRHIRDIEKKNADRLGYPWMTHCLCKPKCKKGFKPI